MIQVSFELYMFFFIKLGELWYWICYWIKYECLVNFA